MDRYSIAPKEVQGPQPIPIKVGDAESSKTLAPEPLRFPGDDSGRSLSEMAQRDLNAALQLLAERAQYITGASGAAIALRDGSEMICRASAGSSAPELGAHLQVDSGLSGESVRTKQILRCDDAETDTRVNRESCRALDIASVMVMPLIREQEVTGVFELFSGRVNAFEERDTLALQRIAEMILTAVEHADAAERAEKEISGATTEMEVVVEPATKAEVATAAPASKPEEKKPEEKKSVAVTPPAAPAPAQTSVPAGKPERLNIHKCAKCGFPVSEGRTLCLDCEAAQAKEAKPVSAAATEAANYVPKFGTGEEVQESWLHSHLYLVGSLVLAAIAVVVWLSLR